MSDIDYLLKKVNIQKIADQGQKIYEKIKNNYEPKYNGKYLAIEIDSGEVFMGKDGATAMYKAQKKYPDRYFFLVKIGFTAAETIAKSYFQ